MTRSSPGVARVVAILNYMAEHPDESFTLTDFIRALRLSRATCHAVLTGLVDANYLYRLSDKSFAFGPALLSVAKAAEKNYSPLRIARPEMRALANEFDAVCSAVFREGDEIVVRERAASRSNLGWSVAQGTRLPLKAPSATNFVSWSSRAEADAFIDQIVPDISPTDRAELQAGIEFSKRMGFQTIAFKSVERPRAIGWLFDEPDAAVPLQVVTELDPDADYPLASLTAPVFDERGRVAFMLALLGFSGVHRGSEVEHMGNRLREACDRVTSFLTGRQA